MKEYLNTAIQWFLTSGVRILIIILITMIAIKLARFLSTRVFSFLKKDKDNEFQKRVDTLSDIIRYIIVIGVLLVAVIMIMDEFGIQIGPVLAAAGIVGLAVGFGAQNLVRDVISGLFVIFENRIRIGDVAIINGT
ncbi:MAG: mechanosensitive ion channel, partial [Deltaproteobacteria bacterium]|nr:mechanosensitive ion channel [Deltaproteobacteria bacterium]